MIEKKIIMKKSAKNNYLFGLNVFKHISKICKAF